MEEMKMDKIMFFIGLLLFVGGFSGLIIDGFILEKYEIMKSVPCYDNRDNVIKDMTCTESTTELPETILLGLLSYKGVMLIFLLSTLIGMTSMVIGAAV
jgi:hypothetical protein